MSNTTAVCTSFKKEQLLALHAFGTTVVRATTAADAFNAALYFASASLDANTTAYSITGEVTGTGYTAGGLGVTNATAPASGSGSGYWTPSADFVWSTLTAAAFDTVLLYNATQSNRAISVTNFGSQSVTASNFTLNMPVNAAGTALVQNN